MATNEKEIPSCSDEEAELFKNAMRKITAAQTAINEATELLSSLYSPQARKRTATDQYGDPTWSYLVKVELPKDMRLTPRLAAYGAEFGFNEQSMQTLMYGKGTYEGFIKHYQRTGTKWKDWSLVFMKWVRTEHERKKKASDGGGARTKFDQYRTRS